jgi:hypothetical protein
VGEWHWDFRINPAFRWWCQDASPTCGSGRHRSKDDVPDRLCHCDRLAGSPRPLFGPSCGSNQPCRATALPTPLPDS